VEPEKEDQDAAVSELAPADWATADEIRRKSFSTTAEGYDPDEVRAYLSGLAEWFAHLAQLKAGPVVTSEVPVAHGAEGSVSELATRMADVLREAEEHATRIREEAEGEARLLLAGAEEQAERERATVLAESRQNAERLATEAREAAERTGGQALMLLRDAERRLAEAANLRDALLAELQAAWERISAVTVPPPDQAFRTPADPSSDEPLAVDASSALPLPAQPRPDPVEAPLLEMPLPVDGASENEHVPG
jgi:DivIVA domain-containing protein